MPRRTARAFRFVHALTREAIYEGVLPPRRRLWHRRVAETLAAGAQPDPDTVAYHFQQAGDPRAWEWLKRAGERAQRAYAWLTAIERFRAAADLLAGVEGTERMRGHILYLIARLRRLSNPDDAIADVDEAGRLAAQSGDDILAAEVHYHRGILLCYSDHFRDGLAEMVAGIEALEAMPFATTRASNISEFWLADSLPTIAKIGLDDDDLAATRLHAAGFHFRRGAHPWFLASAGRFREAIDVAERYDAALAGLPETSGGIRSTAAFSLHGLGIARAALGFPAAAKDAFVRSRALFGAIDHHALIAFSLLQKLHDVALTYEAADPAARRGLAAEAEAALERAGGALSPGLDPRLASLRCLVLDGRWQEARAVLDACPPPGNAFLRREITQTRALLAHHCGDAERVWAEIRSLVPGGPATEPGDIIHQEGLFLQRLAVDLCLDAGDLRTARAWLEAHDRWLAWSESVLGRADGLVCSARWQRATGNLERARNLAAEALALAAAP